MGEQGRPYSGDEPMPRNGIAQTKEAGSWGSRRLGCRPWIGKHIRSEYFTPPYPVCTAVAVRDLVHPDWILEIEAIAYIGDKK